MAFKIFLALLLVTCVWGSEYELAKNEMVDIEILFPKQGNPVNNVPSTADEREKGNRLISFIDRLLNRNQGTQTQAASNTGTGTVNNNAGASLLATTRRSLLSSLIFIPDVNKGVDTILSGVASGNLEQIISGSFIFTPNRVQSVASTVINRVFGGQTIANINNNATQTQTGTQQEQGNNVNNILQQLGLNGQQKNTNNLGQSVVNNAQKQQPNGNNNIQNLINGVFGQFLPNTAQSLQNTAQTLQNTQQQVGNQKL